MVSQFQSNGDMEHRDSARVNLELMEQGVLKLLESNLLNNWTGSIIHEVMHIYTMRRVQRCKCSKTGIQVQ